MDRTAYFTARDQFGPMVWIRYLKNPETLWQPLPVPDFKLTIVIKIVIKMGKVEEMEMCVFPYQYFFNFFFFLFFIKHVFPPSSVLLDLSDDWAQIKYFLYMIFRKADSLVPTLQESCADVDGWLCSLARVLFTSETITRKMCWLLSRQILLLYLSLCSCSLLKMLVIFKFEPLFMSLRGKKCLYVLSYWILCICKCRSSWCEVSYWTHWDLLSIKV